MKWLLNKYSLPGVFFILTVLIVYGCGRDNVDTPDYSGNGNALSISASSSRAGDLESAIRTLRLFVFSADDGNMLLNKLYKTTEAVTAIPSDSYTYFANINGEYKISELLPRKSIRVMLVANEPTALNGNYTIERLRGTVLNYYDAYAKDGLMNIQIDGAGTTTNRGYIPMYAETAVLTHYEWNAGNGKVVNMPLVRTLAKVTLQLSKGDKPIDGFTDAGDKLTISSAAVTFIPMYSYLGDNTLPYEAEQVATEKQNFTPALEITPSVGKVSSNQLSFYIPEHILSDIAFNNRKYTAIQINAAYYSGATGETINSSYRIALGDGVAGLSSPGNITGLTKADLSISRNTEYRVKAQVTSTGKLDILQVKVDIAPWEGTEDVEGDADAPWMNITNTGVAMSQKVVRVRFWSNQADIHIESTGETDGGPFTVDDIFKNLSVPGDHFRLYAEGDPEYTAYNGYMDLEFTGDNYYNTERTYSLVLNAGGLKRTITVEANPRVGEIIFDANGGSGTYTREIRYAELNGKALSETDISVTIPAGMFTPPAGKELLMWVYSNGESAIVQAGGSDYVITPTGYITRIKALWKNKI